MALQCGIIGLPQVGKTTIFNALTAAGARVGGFSGASDNPNIAQVAVPDPRLDDLAKAFKSKKITPATLRFVDVAGLAKGSSRADGLGGRLLAHVREVDLLVHVARCFENEHVSHVEGSIDPVRDAETIQIELALADLETVEKNMERAAKTARSGDKKAKELLAVLERVKVPLEDGRAAREASLKEEETTLLRDLSLLTLKPMIHVANVDESGLVPDHPLALALEAMAAQDDTLCVRICGQIEAEMATLPPEERDEFMQVYGLKRSGLDKLITASFDLLNLMTFLTAGEKETRAWNIKRETRAPQAAGKIHSDIERGFIRLEVYDYDDWVSCGRDEKKVKEKGLWRSEGKDYVMRDGDVCLFRFNV